MFLLCLSTILVIDKVKYNALHLKNNNNSKKVRNPFIA